MKILFARVLKLKSSSWVKTPDMGMCRCFFCGGNHAVVLLLLLLRKLSVAGLLQLALAACQTTPLTYLPSSLQQKFFGACGNEGSVSFKLLRNSDYLVSGFIDWDLTAGLHLSNVMGSTIALLKRDSKADIQLPNSVLSIVVDRAGRIVISGDFTGLYLEELYCLLGGRVPLSWHREKVVARERDYLITAIARERKIITAVGVQRFQVRLARRILWVFSAGELVIGSYRRQTGYLEGQGFRLDWQQSQ